MNVTKDTITMGRLRRYSFLILYFLITALLWDAGQVQAHHSFAVHYLPDKIISIAGVVKEFRFTNPHGLVFLTVKGTNGEEQAWRAETNSPNALRRRGWSNTSIKPGDTITIEGYPARDGSNLLRVSRVVLPDGRILPGQGQVLANPQDDAN